MNSSRRRSRWVPFLVALTCIGCSEEEPAVKVVISGHPDTYAETRLRGDETITLTYLEEPFAQSGVKAMGVRWEARTGTTWRTISTSPRVSARLLPPGADRLQVTVLKNGSYFDSGVRPIRVLEPRQPRAAPSPAALPQPAGPADHAPEPVPQPAAPDPAPRSGSSGGLSGALGR